MADTHITGLAARADQRRTVIFRYFEVHKLKQLEMAANQAPQDPMKQYRFMQELGRNYPEAVIQRYESNQFALNEGVTKEYLKVGCSTPFPSQSCLFLRRIFTLFCVSIEYRDCLLMAVFCTFVQALTKVGRLDKMPLSQIVEPFASTAGSGAAAGGQS